VPREVALTVLERLHDSKRLVELDGRASPGWGARGYGPGSWIHPEKLETDLRIATLERNPDAIARVVAAAQSHLHRTDFGMWLVYSLGSSAPLTVLDCLAHEHRVLYLRTLVRFSRTIIEPIAEHLIDAALDLDEKQLRLDVGRLLILRGESERALGLDALPKHGAEGLSYWRRFGPATTPRRRGWAPRQSHR
jgi:hypothetical protein